MIKRTGTVGGLFASTALLTMATLTFDASPARAANCSSPKVVAGARNAGDSNMSGVRGVATVQSTPANLASGRVGAADVYGYGSDNKDFVQLGWIYGGGTGTTLMPYSASPRAFLGEEYLGQPGDEILQPILGLSPGSTHGFELRRVEDGNSPNYGKYYAFVDGVQRGITKIAHLRIAAPAVNGEVTTGCVPMRSQWANTGVPYANLQYFRPSTGAWYYWAQTSFFNDGGSCWYSVPYGNAGATDFAASDYNQPGCPFQ